VAFLQTLSDPSITTEARWEWPIQINLAHHRL
jgi:hypothetical protein